MKKQPGTNTLTIKNMVCDRCIRVVREELQKLGLDVRNVSLGEVIIGDTGSINRDAIRKVLNASGFDIVDNHKAKMIEKIKNAVIRLIHHKNGLEEFEANYSEYLARELHADYHYLSSLFSSVEGITIEKFFILQKIERVKELIKYDEMTLSEIAFQMGYSSVAHLSNQFKKITGLTPSSFKQMTNSQRMPIDLVAIKTPR